jgi:hypothetical protein
MNTFDEDPFRLNQPTPPKSFEHKSHSILLNPIEIDLSQPDRAEDISIEAITGFPESKLIAEILTPADTLDIIHTQAPNIDPIVMILYCNSGKRLVLNPGDVIDLSVGDAKGKCILAIDETGHHVYVYADNPADGYKLFTRELEQFKVSSSEEHVDDPDAPYQISQS